MSQAFDIHLLGCGSAKPSSRHNPSCTVVNHRGNLFMVDCGEGAQQQFQKQHLSLSRLKHIFLTHLHGDHVFGLPGLIGTLALSGITGAVTIHTFEEGRKVLSGIFDYFNRDLPIDIVWNVIEPREAVIWENASLRVRTVPLQHRLPAVGYVFEEKGKLRHLDRASCDFHGVPMWQYNAIKAGADFVKPDGVTIPNARLTTAPTPALSYAHIGDTAYLPDLAEKIRDVNVLFHETTYPESMIAKAAPRGHSTARQAATVARDAGAGALITGHYSSSVKDESIFLTEAREVFPNTIFGQEGLVVDVHSPMASASPQ